MKQQRKEKRDDDGAVKLKAVHDSRVHRSMSVSERTSELVSKRSGTGIKLVSKQLSGRGAKSKKVFIGGCHSDSQTIRRSVRMAGAGRDRPAVRPNESGVEESFRDAGSLLSLTLSKLTPQDLLQLLSSLTENFDFMRGDWVTTWLFPDVETANDMHDLIRARFIGEKRGSRLVPHSRSLIYSEHAQCYGTRSIWKDQKLFEIILAASLTQHRKSCVYIGSYDSWYHHDRMYQKAIAAWDTNGLFGKDPEMTELLKRHVGFYRTEGPLLRVV
jgi:hypothetical protein